MKLLVIIPYVPDLVRVRPYQLLRGLAARGHSVTLLTLSSTPSEETAAAELRKVGITVETFPLSKKSAYLNCLRAIPTTKPLQAVYCWHPGLAARALNLRSRGNFDAFHVEHLRGVAYALSLLHSQPDLPLVWDSVDNISHLFRQAVINDPSFVKRNLRLLELRRTERYEADLCAQIPRIAVTSPLDRTAFERLARERNASMRADLRVIPNGTDLDYFSPDPDMPRENETLVVSGKMSYHANIHMTLFLAREVLPLVWRHRPDVRLVVVGKDPPQQIRSLAADPRFQITGTVADIRPYLRQATVAVAPVQYGAGIQNKVLEAMGCATPVVCSPTAVSALQAIPEQDLLVADRAEDFARQVLRLLNDPQIRDRVGTAGRKYIEEHHRWDGIVRQFEDFYQS